MMNTSNPMVGLIAATFTPLNGDDSLNTAAIPPIVDHLVEHGIVARYVFEYEGAR